MKGRGLVKDNSMRESWFFFVTFPIIPLIYTILVENVIFSAR